MTLEQLKQMSVIELKALAFDLSQDRDQINQSINLILNILSEKVKIEEPIKVPSTEEIK